MNSVIPHAALITTLLAALVGSANSQEPNARLTRVEERLARLEQTTQAPTPTNFATPSQTQQDAEKWRMDREQLEKSLYGAVSTIRKLQAEIDELRSQLAAQSRRQEATPQTYQAPVVIRNRFPYPITLYVDRCLVSAPPGDTTFYVANIAESGRDVAIHTTAEAHKVWHVDPPGRLIEIASR